MRAVGALIGVVVPEGVRQPVEINLREGITDVGVEAVLEDSDLLSISDSNVSATIREVHLSI